MDGAQIDEKNKEQRLIKPLTKAESEFTLTLQKIVDRFQLANSQLVGKLLAREQWFNREKPTLVTQNLTRKQRFIKKDRKLDQYKKPDGFATRTFNATAAGGWETLHTIPRNACLHNLSITPAGNAAILEVRITRPNRGENPSFFIARPLALTMVFAEIEDIGIEVEVSDLLEINVGVDTTVYVNTAWSGLGKGPITLPD